MSASATSFVGEPRPGRAAAEWIYRLLLRAYPPAFRLEYGREMTQLFRDQWREGDVDALRFWLTVMWDVAQSAPALRVEAWRARACEGTRTLGVIMKLVAMLTVLLGVFGILSAVAEGVMGMRQGVGGTYLAAVAIGLVAAALLLVAGVAALRSTEPGRRMASRAALASLAAFVLARLVFGWMSIFAQLVAIVLPLGILAVLHWPHRRGPYAAGGG
jgi:hypothetical protein